MTRQTPLPRASRHNTWGTLLALLITALVLTAAQYAMMRWLCPRYLAEQLPDIRMLLPERLTGLLPEAAFASTDRAWKIVVTALDALGALMMLVIWALWRHGAARGRGTHAEASRRAMRSGRTAVIITALLELALCAGMWVLGLVSVKPALTMLAAWLVPVLCVPCAAQLQRLGAPGVISGKHAHFARII